MQAKLCLVKVKESDVQLRPVHKSGHIFVITREVLHCKLRNFPFVNFSCCSREGSQR